MKIPFKDIKEYNERFAGMVLCIVFLLILFLFGFNLKREVEVNILATADLHSLVPDRLIFLVEEERKRYDNLILVDAGDFFDWKSQEMKEWLTGRRLVRVVDDVPIYKTVAKEREGVAPIVKEMANLKYDAVVLGNHEFVSNDKESLDNLIFDFENHDISVLSANTYKSNGDNYTKPYIIKEIQTSKGSVDVGILGFTIKEVGERYNWDIEKEKLVPAKSRELKDLKGYDGKLYINDLVEDARKWTQIMKKEDPDIIIAVVHSGEKPKKPKNPGNRIQEIAREVEGIDAIVAAHTHKEISQHDYKNKYGETVIVTQPGSHGQCISKLTFKLKRKKDEWTIVSKKGEIYR